MLNIITFGIDEEDIRPNIEIDEETLEDCGVTLEEFKNKLDLDLVSKVFENILKILAKEEQ